MDSDITIREVLFYFTLAMALFLLGMAGTRELPEKEQTSAIWVVGILAIGLFLGGILL